MDKSPDLYDVALGVLAGTPAALAALLEPLPPDLWAWSPAAGEWSPQDILSHLLHVETAVIPVRVRRMLEEDGAPFASATLADKAETSRTPTQMLADWQAAREANLTFLRTLTREQLAHGGEHPRYGHIRARAHHRVGLSRSGAPAAAPGDDRGAPVSRHRGLP